MQHVIVNGITLGIADAVVEQLLLEKLRGPAPPAALELSSVDSKVPVHVLGQSYDLGIYAGLVRGLDGAPDYHLFIADEHDGALTWDAANKWGQDDDKGGDIGTRREHRIAFVNVRELFKAEAYWTNEQRADDSDYAWFQGFSNGNQYYCTKGSKLRARLFRRLSLL